MLLTPDDEGHRMGHPGEKKPRARQNVVLELGMFLSTLGRKHVAILHKGDVELPVRYPRARLHPVHQPCQRGKATTGSRNSRKLASIST